jgi:hypothetical protein
MEALRINTKKVETIKTIMFMLGGIIAGLLGLIGIHGVYLLLSIAGIYFIMIKIYNKNLELTLINYYYYYYYYYK